MKRNIFYRKGRNIIYNPIDQFSILFYQERFGRQFAHPHIYPTGQPDWDHSKVWSPTDLIVRLIETITLRNVYEYSLQHALTSSPIFGKLSEVQSNVMKHREDISRILNCPSIISDSSELKKAVDKYYHDRLIAKFTEIVPDWAEIYEVNIKDVD